MWNISLKTTFKETVENNTDIGYTNSEAVDENKYFKLGLYFRRMSIRNKSQ